MSYKRPDPIKLKVPSTEDLAKKDPSEYNEVEKMVAGIPFKLFDQTLLNGQAFAKTLIRKINTADPLDFDLRQELFSQLLGTYCKETNEIEPPFTCDYGSNVHLGKGVFINSNCVILDGTEVRIGDYTLLGPGVHIYVADHSLDPTRRLEVYTKPITIGKYVWIGGNVTITSGVTIGDGVTIGAGSVVTKDIEPYSVAVGVPARVIKKVQPPSENQDISTKN